MKAIRTILACLRHADEKYNLINVNDKIVVGVSGGKDSLLLVYALHLYQKFNHTSFTIQPVTLDLGFPNFDPKPIQEFMEKLGLNLIVRDAKEVYPILLAHKKEEGHLPCSICSRMKKAAINNVANELGFNKVAFAHHADDAIETYLMNNIYGGRIATFSPKMKLERADIVFIRPFILCRESDIQKAVKELEIPVSLSACPADKHTMREETKNILNNIYHNYPVAKESFLSMLSNYEHLDIWTDKVEYNVDKNGLILKPITLPYEMSEAINIQSKDKLHKDSDEFDLEKEKSSTHFLIKLNEETIGTISYHIKDKNIEIYHFALLEKYQNKDYEEKVLFYLTNLLSRKYTPCLIFIKPSDDLIPLLKELGFTQKEENNLIMYKES